VATVFFIFKKNLEGVFGPSFSFVAKFDIGAIFFFQTGDKSLAIPLAWKRKSSGLHITRVF
jgi:hypothetical protein